MTSEDQHNQAEQFFCKERKDLKLWNDLYTNTDTTAQQTSKIET